MEACTARAGGPCSCGMVVVKRRKPGPKVRYTEATKLTELPADVLNANARYDPQGAW